MKILKRILNWTLTAVLVVTVGIVLISVVSSRSNHGVPNFFGTQIMVVKSDSMAPTMKVGTGVVVRKIDPAKLVPQLKSADGEIEVAGDIISYYSPRLGVVITHRLIAVKEEGGSYTLTAIGENRDSDQCQSGGEQTVCVYTPEAVKEENYLGKVVGISDPLGGFLRLISNPVAVGLLIGVPAAFIVGSLVYDYFKGRDEEKEEEQ